MAARNRFKFKNVLGNDNPAGLYTKYLDEKASNHHAAILSFRSKGGRVGEAPQLHVLSQSRDECENGTNLLDCELTKVIAEAVDNAWHKERKPNTHGQTKWWKTTGKGNVVTNHCGPQGETTILASTDSRMQSSTMSNRNKSDCIATKLKLA